MKGKRTLRKLKRGVSKLSGPIGYSLLGAYTTSSAVVITSTTTLSPMVAACTTVGYVTAAAVTIATCSALADRAAKKFCKCKKKS